MADSLLDLGSTPVFPLEPNWVSQPSTNISLSRNLLAYRGTKHSIFPITDDAPITFEAHFTIYEKSDEDTFLDFFHARRGRNQRFWVKHPRQHFALKETASNGALSMVCYPNSAHDQFQGYERIYVVMSTGDIVTRKVNSATYSSDDDEINLAINSALDRDITISNQILIGRVLLCRFDSDELSVSHVTTTTCEFSLKFYELVKEYEEA